MHVSAPSGLRVDPRVPLVVIPEDQCRLKREAKQKMRTSAELQRKSTSPNAVTSTEPLVGALSVETRELINRIVALDLQFATPSNDSIVQLSVSISVHPICVINFHWCCFFFLPIKKQFESNDYAELSETFVNASFIHLKRF